MKKFILVVIATLGLFAGTASMASAALPPTEGGICVSGNVTTGAPILYWHKVFLFKPNGSPLLTWGGSQAFYWVCTTTP